MLDYDGCMWKLIALTLVAFVIVAGCGDSDSKLETPVADESAVPSVFSAPTVAETEVPEPPEILATPNVQTGDGWTMETLVVNLDELDLAVAVYPGGLTLLDVRSGRGVARADFAGSVYVRIRENPLQLIVSYSSGDRGYRLLIFDVLERGFALKHELALPQRYGHQGFTNAMHLSNDGRFAYFGERDLIDHPECSGDSVDGVACLRYSIRIVDLDEPSAIHERIQVPERCYPSITAYGEASVAAYCSGSPGTLIISADGGAPRAIEGYELIPQPSVAGWPDYVGGEYATVLADGSPRVLYGDGSLRGAPDDGRTAAAAIVAEPVLSPGHTSYGVEKIDDARVLSSGERRAGGAPTAHLRVFNLRSGQVEQAMPAPAGVLHATVLGEERGVALTRDGDRYSIQIIDFARGTLSAPIELTELGGEPQMIVR